MSPSAARLAVRQGRRNDMVPVAAMVTGLARCSLRFVPSVGRIPKCRLNLVKVDPYIVASASVKYEQIGKLKFILDNSI